MTSGLRKQVGAIEQHGPHPPLSDDSDHADARS